MQHAWVVYGPEGPERRQAARRQAALLAGGDRAEELAAAGHHPDIDEYLDPLRIEPVRVIAASAGRPPVLGNRRVALLGGLDGATREAQSALLRIVEDPPDTLAFVGEATGPGVLLPTLRSRFLSRTMRRTGSAEIIRQLDEALPLAPAWAKAAASEAARGSMDRAQAIAAGLVALADSLSPDDGRPDWFVRAAEQVAELPKTWPAGLAATFEEHWHRMGDERWLESWRWAAQAERQLQTTASARLVAEVFLLRLQRLRTMQDWPPHPLQTP